MHSFYMLSGDLAVKLQAAVKEMKSLYPRIDGLAIVGSKKESRVESLYPLNLAKAECMIVSDHWRLDC